MKRLYNTILLSGLLVQCLSCSYKESFPYRGDSLINFKTDSMYFSFGALPFNVTDTTLQIGVEIIGAPAQYDRKYTYSLDGSRTTARVREHYEMPDMSGFIRSGQSSGIIELTIHRLNLQSDSVFVVAMDMEVGDDFRLGVLEYRTIAVAFTNRLDMPDWWSVLSPWLGEYNSRKYQKFIELWGGSITRQDVNEKKYAILRVFKEVKAFFEANPEFGVTFPDVEWPV